jgi:predicted TPR repeat methyltransferase
MADRFLDKVYTLGADTPTETLYKDWAATYDREVTEAGYATPGRSAEALASIVEDTSAPILDMGCGTGLSGIALRAAGFTVIDGVDLTEEMLEKARTLTLYRDLLRTDVSDPLPFKEGTHAHVAAIGLFSPSHAPASTVDLVLRYLPSGGCFVFSLNDHALADPTYEGVILNWVDCGAARILFKEYGDHLPAEGIQSVVYVLQKS